ncbi:MAG: ChaN family lipoprotein [Desulfatiglandales bacterium]
MTKLREQLIKIQKRNYRKSVKLVRESLGYSPGIETYEKEYLYYLKDYEGISTKAEFIKRVLSSDVVFHGDYHTLRQSQRAVLHILREIQGKRDIILCLEMFHAEDQRLVDGFMSGELSENSFLEKIDYDRKWPFRWSHWRPIVSHCREKGIAVLGINVQTDRDEGIKRLRNRDRFSARIIAKAFIRHPGRLIYVVDGDYHVAPSHLPKNVDQLLKALGERARAMVIFQNAENLYWKLCARGLEESDVLKIDENVYCVMNTMPANKIQSYLNWLEYSDDAYFPVHQDWEDTGFEERGVRVHEMVATLASIFRVKLPNDALQKLTIYYPDNLGFMEIVHDTPGLKGRLRLIREKIKRNEGFLLEYGHSGEEAYMIYLANSSINMAAEEACHFLHAVLRGPQKRSDSHFDRFYRHVIMECLGFFGSKFINEKRKAQTENALRKFLGKVRQGELRQADHKTIQVARLLLQHFYMERKTSDIHEFVKKFHALYQSRSVVSRMFSTQLGYMLGNKLYYAVKGEKFPLERIRELLCDPLDKPESAFRYYREISRRIKKVKHVSRF